MGSHSETPETIYKQAVSLSRKGFFAHDSQSIQAAQCTSCAFVDSSDEGVNPLKLALVESPYRKIARLGSESDLRACEGSRRFL